MISTTVLLVVIAYLLMGAVFAYHLAISPQAIVILIFLWPLFGVLIVIAPIINWWVNRNDA